MSTMKAIGYYSSQPIQNDMALVDLERPIPRPSGKDILVKVEAISVNPVDTKIRKGVQPPENEAKILGWDVAGVVTEIGDEVTLFQPGDRVWYAGAIDREGANAEFHLVDERIVSRMPESLSFSQAAAMPLTSITAWEILFDRLTLNSATTGTLLVIGGAGGVGSILIQLAKQLTNLTIIATASREDSKAWVRSLGADGCINHQQALSDELKTQGIESVDYVVSLTHTDVHLSEIAKVIKPQGKFAVIDDPDTLDIMPFKTKSVSVHWELMFTRSLFLTDDMILQHVLLAKVAEMVDNKQLRTTMNEDFGRINAANLKRAHAFIESGKALGKVVLTGFDTDQT